MEINYNIYHQEDLKGRYITLLHIAPYIHSLKDAYHISIAGFSEEDQPVYELKIGTGATRILIWSQMHGNESTTTKALIDFLYYLKSDASEKIRSRFTFSILPMLNPDGARNYTRFNANGVDLNRDAFEVTQKESKILRKIYEHFSPDFAFNLHDQRTIFSAGDNRKPATLSFLSPAFDEHRAVNESRKKAMQLIAGISEGLQEVLPEQIGRYDDAFNINCIGDYLMHRGTPAILFEAGHYPGDYDREETRRYVFLALYLSMEQLLSGSYHQYTVGHYLKIPENKKKFVDILVKMNNGGCSEYPKSISFQYQEVLADNKIQYIARVNNELTDNSYGHLEITAEQEIFSRNLESSDNLEFFGLLQQENGLWSVNNLLMK